MQTHLKNTILMKNKIIVQRKSFQEALTGKRSRNPVEQQGGFGRREFTAAKTIPAIPRFHSITKLPTNGMS